MRPPPMTPEQMDSIASTLLSVDQWMGIPSPISSSLVFGNVTSNKRVTSALMKMARPSDKKQKYFTETSFDSLMEDASRAINSMEKDQAKQASMEEEMIASSAMKRISATASALGIATREPSDIMKVVKMLSVMQRAAVVLLVHGFWYDHMISPKIAIYLHIHKQVRTRF